MNCLFPLKIFPDYTLEIYFLESINFSTYRQLTALPKKQVDQHDTDNAPIAC